MCITCSYTISNFRADDATGGQMTITQMSYDLMEQKRNFQLSVQNLSEKKLHIAQIEEKFLFLFVPTGWESQVEIFTEDGHGVCFYLTHK